MVTITIKAKATKWRAGLRI